MSKIRNLTRNGETFYPLTHVDGVIGRNGVPLGEVNGIFDVSEYNATGDPLINAQYDTLPLALAVVPQERQKGGMTIRYIDSVSGKYVQYRYMSTSTSSTDFVNTSNWQGVDDEPTAGSKNMVKSGGVRTAIDNAEKDITARLVMLDAYKQTFVSPPHAKIAVPELKIPAGNYKISFRAANDESFIITFYNNHSAIVQFSSSAKSKELTFDTDLDNISIAFNTDAECITMTIVNYDNSIRKETERAKAEESIREVYQVRDHSTFEWAKNYRIGTTGKSSIANGYAKSKAIYAKKGTIIGVSSENYTFDYSIWNTPTTGSGSAIVTERNLSGTVTINYDGYLFIALHEIGHDTALTDEEVQQLVSDALIATIYYPVKEDVEKKVDYTIEQSLTEEQQTRARNNIGAASTDVEDEIAEIKEELIIYDDSPEGVFYVQKVVNGSGGLVNYKNHVTTNKIIIPSGSYVNVSEDAPIEDDLVVRIAFYNKETGEFISNSSWAKEHTLEEGYIIRASIAKRADVAAYSTVLPLSYSAYFDWGIKKNRLDNLQEEIEQLTDDSGVGKSENLSGLVAAQKYVANDWHFPFINVTGLGYGANHVIPGTATIWSESGTKDLVQKDIMMQDGTHPYSGRDTGMMNNMKMYGRSIANQFALVSPSYFRIDEHSDEGNSYWVGRRFAWMGTSIPAGVQDSSIQYPRYVEIQLGADVNNSVNLARGSSCVRIFNSDGSVCSIPYTHFVRSLTRTVAEANYYGASEENWQEMKDLYSNAPDYGTSTMTSWINTMVNHSFETLLKPYLDGTYTMPDVFVIDHGHNDTANDINGELDFYILPTQDNIANGKLAEDEYMTVNDYANLKTALGNDLSKVGDIASFSASLNRNCFIGAMNFLITVIMRYNPYARIVIISDYN